MRHDAVEEAMSAAFPALDTHAETPFPMLQHVPDRRTRHLMRDFLEHVVAAIDRGEFPDKQAAAEFLLQHEVPVPLAVDLLRRHWK
jgi:hypothetical protein